MPKRRKETSGLMVKVVRPIPIRPPERISQHSLEQLFALSNLARAIHKRLKQAEAELFNRLDAGVGVEPGIHSAEIVESLEGGTRIQKLGVY